MAVLSGEHLRLPPDARAWTAVTYLALVGSVLAFLIYFSLLKTWASTTVSFFAVFTPIIAIVLGTLFLGESLSVWSLAGSALILTGVSITLVSPRRRSQSPARIG
jgi:drug/metabolite transporter (DMT)-like permease